jgi:hypothetical protein
MAEIEKLLDVTSSPFLFLLSGLEFSLQIYMELTNDTWPMMSSIQCMEIVETLVVNAVK